jgi:4-alpha-glucanotransferase
MVNHDRTSHDTALRALAERLGILSSYVSQDGREIRSTSDETRVAILAAMGYDASIEELAREALDELTERDAERVAEPVRVVRERNLSERELPERELPDAEHGGLRFHIPDSWRVRAGERVEYRLAIAPEWEGALGSRDPGGREERNRGSSAGAGGAARSRASGDAAVSREGAAAIAEHGHFSVVLESPLAPGYYELRITVAAGGRRADALQRLVVVPDRCVIPARKGYGIIANLYSIRGARSWGVGDLTDLAELARWSGEGGAAFVGVNPLHALRTVGGEVSPYSPVSRLYRNPAYLDVVAIPELSECTEARAMLDNDSIRAELATIRSSDRVEYERRARLARPILEALHRCSTEGNGREAGERRRAYHEYREREGRALDDFATFSALDEHMAHASSAAVTWHQWPSEFRSPHSPAVAEFARTHQTEVDFHRWLQFELDRQLGAAAAAGTNAGLTIGLYQDLAVASAPYGSDAWARPQVHANGVSFGAPPDEYSATGQNWGLTPLDPHRLRDEGYRFWSTLVRAALRHAGAVRIDHVLGLFRQFWIPHGMNGTQGAYVRFPTHDLLGILALESAMHGAVIVGEDLGTVPPEVPGTLREWGVLGTRVMLFERERDRTFRPAASYEPLSLTTADTHDLPTLAGFWEGKDVALAARVGRIADAGAEHAALRFRQNDRRLMADRLIADGVLEVDEAVVETADDPLAGGAPPSSTRVTSTPPTTSANLSPAGTPTAADEQLRLPGTTRIVAAVHRFLCSTPAILVGISLDDLAGETEPVNLPGVSAEHFESWTRRMRTPLPELIGRAGLIPPSGCQDRR